MEWVESHVDLSVKVAGGSVAVRRTWSRGQWYVNFAWADLKFTRDPLDNTIKSIDRGGSIFERQGGTTAYTPGSAAPAADAIGTSYVFDRQYVIRRTATGWRWSDRRGNVIDYSALGRIQSYAERTGTTVRFAYETAAAGLTDKLLAVNDHFGNAALTFSYTGEQLTRISDRAGRGVNYGYSNNRLTTVTDPTGAVTRYEYNADGQITKITDSENRSWSLTYSVSLPAPAGIGSRGETLKRADVGPANPNAGPVYQVGSQSLTGAVTGIQTLTVTASGTNFGGGGTLSFGGTGNESSINTVFGAAGGSGGGINPFATPIGSGVDANLNNRLKSGGVISGTSPTTVGASSRANTVSRVASVTDPLGQVTTYELDYDRIARQYITVVKPPATPAIAATGSLPALPGKPGRIINSLYDREGRLLQQALGAGAGRITSTLNRLSPFLEETVDERNLKTTTQYDAARNPLSITTADGVSTTNTYDANLSLPLTRVDERGTLTRYQYDSLGNLLKMIEAAGTAEARLTEYSYDSRDGFKANRLSMTRRAIAPTAPTVNATGSTTDIGSAIPDAQRDATTTYTFDGYGNLTSVTDSEGNVTLHSQIDPLGNVTQKTDPRGVQSQMQYDALGRITQITEAKATADERSMSYSYDGTGLRKTMTDARGNSTTYQYDLLKRSISTTDANGNSTRTDYDAEGRKTRDIDADGVAMTYSHDADGRPTGSVDAAGNATTFIYGNLPGSNSTTPGVQAGLEGLLAAVQYPTYREDYRYDVRNRQTQVIQNLDASTRYTTTTQYDAVGNPVKRIDPKGAATSTDYDRFNRATKITDPAGGATLFAYDRRDNLIAVTDPKNSVTQYQYDKANRKIKETRPGGEFTTYAYDANGNLSRAVSATGRARSYSYDSLNRRTKEEHYLPATGGVLGTAASTQSATTAARVISYQYDKNGNLTSFEDRERAGAFNAPVGANPTSIATPTPTTETLVSNGSYAFDKLNRLSAQTLGYGNPIAVSQSGNAASINAAASLSPLFSKTHSQTFTAAGRKQTRTDPDGNGSNKSHSFTYDSAGRLATIALPATAQNAAVGATSGAITISQYRWNQPSEITYPNSLKQTTTRDALMRPTNINVAPSSNPANAAANTPMNFGYVFDEVSNINQITRQGRATTYGYDALYRLTEAIPAPTIASGSTPPSSTSLPAERYSYDLVHNRLTENRTGGDGNTATPSLTNVNLAYSYNVNHQITEIRNSGLPTTDAASLIQSFSYSADGHTTQIQTNAQIQNNVQLPERPENRVFIYDAQERLITVADGGNIIAMYRYDPFGRRILKTLTQQGADNANTQQAKQLASGSNTPNVNAGSTFYGYTDEGLVAEYQSNATGDMLAAYGYLPNQTWQTNPAYKRDTAFATNPLNPQSPDRIHLFHNDHLGSPQRLTDSDGKTSWSASFESFGRGYADTSAGTTPAVTSSTPTANNHRFPGQFLDAETGLAQNYFRDYLAGIGRYDKRDPIGLNGGVNLYTYVGANSNARKDANGLWLSHIHYIASSKGASMAGCPMGASARFGWNSAGVDFWPNYEGNPQSTGNAHQHGMRTCAKGEAPVSPESGEEAVWQYIANNIDQAFSKCDGMALARANHTLQDMFAGGHRGFKCWDGGGTAGWPGFEHFLDDLAPGDAALAQMITIATNLVSKFRGKCDKECEEPCYKL
jgi:RHS repeat-associated protein